MQVRTKEDAGFMPNNSVINIKFPQNYNFPIFSDAFATQIDECDLKYIVEEDQIKIRNYIYQNQAKLQYQNLKKKECDFDRRIEEMQQVINKLRNNRDNFTDSRYKIITDILKKIEVSDRYNIIKYDGTVYVKIGIRIWNKYAVNLMENQKSKYLHHRDNIKLEDIISNFIVYRQATRKMQPSKSSTAKQIMMSIKVIDMLHEDNMLEFVRVKSK